VDKGTEERSRHDRSLVAACRRGDAGAWERLIRRYRRLIYSIPVSYRLDADLADEVFQRVAIKLFEHLDGVRDPDSLASWIAITTRREVWALRRESSKTRPWEDGEAEALPEDPPEVAERLHQVECEHALALAFERLGGACRDLLGLLYLEDPRPSYEDISARLGRPIGSLGPTRARCLKKLRSLYEEEGGTAPFGVPDEDGTDP
jgi:RNA polymerase sigma factor (sigma-70 family)